MLTLDFILTATKATLLNNRETIDLSFAIEMADFDSRRLTPNSLFVALTIGSTNGHDYIDTAIKNGARVVLLSDATCVTEEAKKEAVFLRVDDTLRAFQALARAYREALNIPVIGITGSNGKTTSKDIIASLLATKLSVHKTYKNFNNHIGVPLTLLQVKPTHDVIVVEMGMNHAGELDVLGSIAKPNYVVITNIGESHIEHLGSRENIAHAKGELLPHLQPGGIAFLPYDSEFCELLASKTNEKKCLFKVEKENEHAFFETFKEKNELIAHRIAIKDGLTSFSYGYEHEVVYEMPLYGEHNVLNTIPAIALAQAFGFTQEEIQAGLQAILISPMRFERLIGKNNTCIINDAYNASPTSMKKSSETFLDIFADKRCVLVLGDMYELGDESLAWHRNVGETLNVRSDKVEFLVTVGDATRAISGAFSGRKRHFESKEEAAKFLQVFLHEDFALFFKASRGMKLESIVESLI